MCGWIRGVLAACLVFMMTGVSAQQEGTDEIRLLREELQSLRQDYERRIAELEARLEAAEQRDERVAPAPVPPPAPRSSAGNNAFNPAIGVIFQGQAWSYANDPEDYAIPGFPLGGEAGPVPEGFSLGETEIDISASVDDWFTAWLTVPIHIEDGETHVEVEEAWIETLGLPAGFALRMGRIFSDIGYLNDKHSHAWDFVDQPLPYQAFLGNQYIDDGVQARWVAPTDLYFELGAEWLRGDRYPAAGAANSGMGAWTAHARLGGDVGYSHSWMAGFSWASAESTDRQAGHVHGHEDEHAAEEELGDEAGELAFTGDSDLLIAEFVWKWAPNGNWKQRNFKFQAEYLWRQEKGFYTYPDGDEVAWNVGQEGWYAQAVFQPYPHWRFGLRYDTLSGDYPGDDFIGTPLEPMGYDPSRYSLMTDWSHSEFSRLRLQYTKDRAGLVNDQQWGLQYIYSIGAHGAHSF